MADSQNEEKAKIMDVRDFTHILDYKNILDAVRNKDSELYKTLKIIDPDVDQHLTGKMGFKAVNSYISHPQIKPFTHSLAMLDNDNIERIASIVGDIAEENGRDDLVPTKEDIDGKYKEYSKQMQDKYEVSKKPIKENSMLVRQAHSDIAKANAEKFGKSFVTALLALALPVGYFGGIAFGIIRGAILPVIGSSPFGIMGAGALIGAGILAISTKLFITGTKFLFKKLNAWIANADEKKTKAKALLTKAENDRIDALDVSSANAKSIAVDKMYQRNPLLKYSLNDNSVGRDNFNFDPQATGNLVDDRYFDLSFNGSHSLNGDQGLGLGGTTVQTANNPAQQVPNQGSTTANDSAVVFKDPFSVNGLNGSALDTVIIPKGTNPSQDLGSQQMKNQGANDLVVLASDSQQDKGADDLVVLASDSQRDQNTNDLVDQSSASVSTDEGNKKDSFDVNEAIGKLDERDYKNFEKLAGKYGISTEDLAKFAISSGLDLDDTEAIKSVVETAINVVNAGTDGSQPGD